MTQTSTRIVDHIVHLSPPEGLEETTKAWRNLGFTVVPGGRHADGLTENALVPFEDGSYIELISFTHPLSYYPPGTPTYDARKNHFWATKHPGFIDFAFLGNAGYPSIAAIINARAATAGSGVRYAGEVQGGRVRPDGKILKWLISSPLPEWLDEEDGRTNTEGGRDVRDVRGKLPFFCGDLTPRELRVPQDPSQTTHSNGALGIAHVRLLARSSEEIARLAKQITTVLGSSPLSPSRNPQLGLREGTTRDAVRSIDQLESADGNVAVVASDTTKVEWELDSIWYGDSGYTPILELGLPQNEKEQKWVDERATGLYKMKVRVKEETSYALRTDADPSTSYVELVM